MVRVLHWIDAVGASRVNVNMARDVKNPRQVDTVVGWGDDATLVVSGGAESAGYSEGVVALVCGVVPDSGMVCFCHRRGSIVVVARGTLEWLMDSGRTPGHTS